MSFSGTKGYTTKPKPGVQINPLHPLSRGLVCCWLFNEMSGTQIYDISGHDNHGTLMNMSPNIQGSGWGDSRFGGGLEFDGTDDHINCGNKPSVTITDELMIVAWIKVDVFDTNWQAIVTKGDSSYRLHRYSNSDNVAFGTTGLSNVDLIGTINVNDGQLHCIAAIYTGSKKYIYVDGVLDVSVSATGSILDTGHSLAIGENFQQTGRHFNGIIGPVSIYNKSTTDVKKLYHDPFCNLMQVPIRRYFDVAPPVGVSPTGVFYGPLVGPLGGPI